MSRHAIHLPDFAGVEGPLIVEGEEAHHAIRVKRVQSGAPVTVLSGRGVVGEGVVTGAKKRLEIEIRSVERCGRVTPSVHVWAAPPKGTRMSDLVDGLSQAGAASWTALDSDRTPQIPSEKKMARLERVASEAMKQCRRPWLLELAGRARLDAAGATEQGASLVVADGSGAPYEASGAASIRLLVGPEGGWTDAEIAQLRDAGARIHSFGPHVMRIETAAPIATGIVLAREGWSSSAAPDSGDRAADER